MSRWSQVRNVPKTKVPILPFPLQYDERRAPTATVISRQTKRCHAIEAGQDCVDRSAQVARPFAVNDPHFVNLLFPAGGKIRRDKVPDLARQESVEVQHTIDGENYRFFCHVRSRFLKSVARQPENRYNSHEPFYHWR